MRLPSSVINLTKLKSLSLDRNPDLRLSRSQEAWVMTLLRNGAEVSLDTPVEMSMSAAYDDFEKLYRPQLKKRRKAYQLILKFVDNRASSDSSPLKIKLI